MYVITSDNFPLTNPMNLGLYRREDGEMSAELVRVLELQPNFNACWLSPQLNEVMQPSILTFSLVTFSIACLFAGSFRRPWKDNLCLLASFLWFLATATHSLNRLYLMSGILTHNDQSVHLERFSFILDCFARVLCFLFVQLRARSIKVNRLTALVNILSTFSLVTCFVFGFQSVSLLEEYPSQTFKLGYMITDTVTSLSEYYLIYQCAQNQKTMKLHWFEFTKGFIAICSGTSMLIGQIFAHVIGQDIYRAYYFGLYAAKIAMLEVFNSSEFNNFEVDVDLPEKKSSHPLS
jgi:hypothetical protein